MAEKMNPNMEKIFFRYVLENPNEFEKVENYFFKNDDIQFIYTIIRDEFLISKNKKIPSNQQLLEMIRLRDETKTDFFKLLIKNDTKTMQKEWIEPRFNAWKKSNKIRNNMFAALEYIRNLDEIDYDNVNVASAKIKTLINEIDLVIDNVDDLGLDFDEPTDHYQNNTLNKISTGWNSVDGLLNGGWDASSLVCFIGQTNVGKCVLGDNFVSIKNKNTDIVKVLRVEDFYEMLKNNSNIGLPL
jgi:hypothetical protein